jgi:hypothetical protein
LKGRNKLEKFFSWEMNGQFENMIFPNDESQFMRKRIVEKRVAVCIHAAIRLTIC